MRHILAAACLSALSNVHAQDAWVGGRVEDPADTAAVIGAVIADAGGPGVTTGEDGRYGLDLPAGTHTLVVRAMGFAEQRIPVTLAAGERRTLDIRLTPAVGQLDAVVVSAGKFEQRVGEVTQSLSVLRPELVRDKNITNLNKALDQVPGVVVVDNDPQIRAGSGFSYGAGSRVMMLVDGLPILSGDIGRPSWSFLPIENIEQVEVIKGASSVLYGSAALSGVINVRTAYPRSDPHTRATVFGGVYDAPGDAEAKWWRASPPLFTGASFFHSQKFGAFDLVVGGNAFADQGYVGPERIAPDTLAKDPLRTSDGGYENRVRFNIATRWRDRKVKGLNYGINANVMKSRTTSVFMWDDVQEGLYRPEPGTMTRTLGTQYYLDPFVNYYSQAGTRHSLRVRYYHQAFDNDNDQSNSNGMLYGEYQVQQKADLFGETTITAGLIGQRTTSEAELYSGDPDGNGKNDATTLGAYLQADKKLFGKLMLSAGLRYERFSVNDDEQSTPVYRAGATYQLFRATYLRASYGQGFRFPTIGERYIRTSVGQLNIYPSPGLQPERSYNVEGGIKQGFKLGAFAGYVDAVAFRQDFEDYIEFTFGVWAPPTATNLGGLGFRSLNTGGARITGMEVEATASGAIGPVKVDVLMGYTYTLPVSTTPERTYDQGSYALPGSPPTNYLATSSDTTGHILKFRVQRLFRADIGLGYRRFSGGVSVRYNSHVRNIDKVFVDLDRSGLLPIGASEWMRTHTTGDLITDVRIAYRLTDQVKAAFIVNNLTNEVYAIRPMAIEAPRSFQVQLVLDL
ncbi:MAG: TonB-dependent receptor [Bacteroidetes bacterium]|nr:TonB-dependent receptor [Bacteroidota bacterium]